MQPQSQPRQLGDGHGGQLVRTQRFPVGGEQRFIARPFQPGHIRQPGQFRQRREIGQETGQLAAIGIQRRDMRRPLGDKCQRGSAETVRADQFPDHGKGRVQYAQQRVANVVAIHRQPALALRRRVG